MSSSPEPSEAETPARLWFTGMFTLFWGLWCLLIAFHLLDVEYFVPRWLLFAIGVLFVLLALRVFSMASGGDQVTSGPEAFLRVWIGPLAILVLAVGFDWIGFGPGERHSSGAGWIGSYLLQREVGGLETRIVFGSVGVLLSLLAFVAFLSTWRMQRDKSDARQLHQPR